MHTNSNWQQAKILKYRGLFRTNFDIELRGDIWFIPSNLVSKNELSNFIANDNMDDCSITGNKDNIPRKKLKILILKD